MRLNKVTNPSSSIKVVYLLYSASVGEYVDLGVIG